MALYLDGPMLVIGEEGLSIDPNRSDDLGMADFRHIVDRLSTWSFPGSREELKRLRGKNLAVVRHEEQGADGAQSKGRPSKCNMSFPQPNLQPAVQDRIITCVRINCKKDVASGRAKYERTKLSATYLANPKHSISQVSVRVELPLCIIMINHATETTQDSQASVDSSADYSNPEVISLFLNCDSKSSYATPNVPWGEIEPSNQERTGSVTVFRLDQKPSIPNTSKRYADSACTNYHRSFVVRKVNLVSIWQS
ncbi:Nn.00g105570.m01.CDS01 [Neocucurbitaria sp. VM-36]